MNALLFLVTTFSLAAPSPRRGEAAEGDDVRAHARRVLAAHPVVDGHNDLAPVIFSHSSARALCDHRRNVPDAVLRRLRQNGGIVMVTFVTEFVSQAAADSSAPLWAEYQEQTRGVDDLALRARIGKDIQARMPKIRVTVSEVADHVEQVRDVAGVDHEGLGGDFDGNDDWPEGLEDASGYPALFEQLLRRGWGDEVLGKLASGNILRVMKEAEEVSRRLREARPASIATIGDLDGVGRP